MDEEFHFPFVNFHLSCSDKYQMENDKQRMLFLHDFVNHRVFLKGGYGDCASCWLDKLGHLLPEPFPLC